jgi:hypothetical protein
MFRWPRSSFLGIARAQFREALFAEREVLKGGRRKFKAATVGSKRSFFETLSISHRRLLFSPYLPLPPTQSNKKEKDQSTLGEVSLRLLQPLHLGRQGNPFSLAYISTDHLPGHSPHDASQHIIIMIVVAFPRIHSEPLHPRRGVGPNLYVCKSLFHCTVSVTRERKEEQLKTLTLSAHGGDACGWAKVMLLTSVVSVSVPEKANVRLIHPIAFCWMQNCFHSATEKLSLLHALVPLTLLHSI